MVGHNFLLVSVTKNKSWCEQPHFASRHERCRLPDARAPLLTLGREILQIQKGKTIDDYLKQEVQFHNPPPQTGSHNDLPVCVHLADCYGTSALRGGRHSAA